MENRNEEKVKELAPEQLEETSGGKSIYYLDLQKIACRICGKVLDNQAALEAHIREKHSEPQIHLRF